jgi:hypothetical protein
MLRCTRGFSVVELVVSMAITMVVIAAVFALLDPSRATFQAESESVDVQQRLRVAVDTIGAAVLEAGAGGRVAPLSWSIPAIAPWRRGLSDGDPPGMFRQDAISILSAPSGAAESVLASGAGGRSPTLRLDTASCVRPVCGFAAGTTVVVYEPRSGAHDLATATAVDVAAGTIAVSTGPGFGSYPAGAVVIEVSAETLYLLTDERRGVYQLTKYDDVGGADVPVVDHVVDLTFEYFGDPRPPTLIRPLSDPVGPWTTYGPAPPPIGSSGGFGYPPGENCAFRIDDEGVQVARLPALGTGAALVPLTAELLTDGPWCPDAASPTRWDADLLRVRRVDVVIRVEAALDALRGPAGVLFSRAGTASARFVPDREARFSIALRDATFGR